MTNRGYDYLIGCASISMADGGHGAAALFDRLASMSPIEYRVFPRCPLPLSSLRNDQRIAVPPLIKGYLRAGALICGEPAWDPDFNTADLPILDANGQNGRPLRQALRREASRLNARQRA